MRRLFKIRYLIILLSFFTIIFYTHKGLKSFLVSDYFNIKNVKLTGVINSDVKKLDNFCKRMIGKNIFEINSETAEQISDEWIKRVVIKKLYPADIEVYVYEKLSVFEFIKDGKQYHFLSDNSIISSKRKDALITVDGRYWQKNLVDFQKFIQEKIMQSAEKIVLKDTYISVSLNGVQIKVPYEYERYQFSSKYIDGIMKRYKSLKAIDLRIKNRIYVSGVKI